MIAQFAIDCRLYGGLTKVRNGVFFPKINHYIISYDVGIYYDFENQVDLATNRPEEIVNATEAVVGGSTTSTISVLEKEETNEWVVPTNNTEIVNELNEETEDETEEPTEVPTTSQPQSETSIHFIHQQFISNENNRKEYVDCDKTQFQISTIRIFRQ